jgi:hypothetical protein
MCPGAAAGHRGRVSIEQAAQPAPGPEPPAARAAGGPRRRGASRWAVDLLLITACVVSVLLEPVSIAIHSVIGLVFAGAVGPHLWHRRAWIRGTLRRAWQRRSLSRAVRWSLSQASVLLALTVFVTATGLWDWLEPRTRIAFHGLSSLVLIGFLIRHTWTRRRSLLRRRGAPARASGAAPARGAP